MSESVYSSLQEQCKDAWLMLRPEEFVAWAVKRQPHRPRLKAGSAGLRLYHQLVRQARRRQNVSNLPSVACDHMDGLHLASDPAVRELVAAGVLEEVPLEPGRVKWSSPRSVSWLLTPYACAVFLAYAPARAGAA